MQQKLDKTLFEQLRKYYKWICLALSTLFLLSGFLPWIFTEYDYLSAYQILDGQGRGNGKYFFELTLIMVLPLPISIINLVFKKDFGKKFVSIFILVALLLDVAQQGTYFSILGIKCTAGAGIVVSSTIFAAYICLMLYLSGSGWRPAVEFFCTIVMYILAYSLYGYHNMKSNNTNIFGFMMLLWGMISCLTQFLMGFFNVYNENFNIFTQWNLVVAILTFVCSIFSFIIL